MAALNSDEIDMPVMDLPDGSDSEQDGDESDGEDMNETDLVTGLENEDLIGMSVNASIIDSPDGEHLVLTMDDGTSVSSRIERRIAGDSVDQIIDDVVAQVGEQAESEVIGPGNVQRTTGSDDINPSDGSDEDDPAWRKSVPRHLDSVPDFDQGQKVYPIHPFLPRDPPDTYFRRFFSQGVVESMAEQTNLYASQMKFKDLVKNPTTPEEIESYIGILIMMGLHKLPNFRLYWSTDDMWQVKPVAEVMSVSRFRLLSRAIHLNDNHKAAKKGEPGHDRLHKVRPLLDSLNKSFQAESEISSSQTVDESMILFKGRSTMKQYLPTKPIKRGYKVWVRADAETGYVNMFRVYVGREEGTDDNVGLG